MHQSPNELIAGALPVRRQESGPGAHDWAPLDFPRNSYSHTTVTVFEKTDRPKWFGRSYSTSIWYEAVLALPNPLTVGVKDVPDSRS